MSGTSTPFGLIPTYHPSGILRPKAYKGGIASGLALPIFKYGPVLLATTGVLSPAGATGAFLGSFAGVEYTDATGRRLHSPGWIANTAASDIVAYVWEWPDMIWRIQANGSLPLTSRGDSANFVNPNTGNATTLFSTTQISTALAGAGNTAQLQIVDAFEAIDNLFGDAFTTVLVKIAQPQRAAPFVAV